MAVATGEEAQENAAQQWSSVARSRVKLDARLDANEPPEIDPAAQYFIWCAFGDA
jgi:hypothetical protein